METLNSNLVETLKKECSFGCTISSSYMNRVIVRLKDTDYDGYLGKILKEIQEIIDRFFPLREHNLSLVIRCENSNRENVFKIWKTIGFTSLKTT